MREFDSRTGHQNKENQQSFEIAGSLLFSTFFFVLYCQFLLQPVID
nr:MAG TPA: hypothetical protein [Caudoviricetes sp.]